MKIVFISVDNNQYLYKKCVLNNIYIKNNLNITICSFDNTKENIFISKRYNQFLNSYNYDDDAWFVFCHNDWEILQDPVELIKNLNTDIIWGPIGVFLNPIGKKHFIKEYKGQCYEVKRDGTGLRLQKSIKTETGELVNVLDAQCLIVHSSLIKKYNLRFDEKLEFDMYVEDFSLSALLKYDIKTKILNIKCCHYSQVDDISLRPSYFKMSEYMDKKYKNKPERYLITSVFEKGIKIEAIFPDKIIMNSIL